MSCNCNDDNEYIIQLDNVGVDGYSPTIDFTNQTNKSFTITVNAINGTITSDTIPTYTYLTNSLNSINSTLATHGSNISSINTNINTINNTLATYGSKINIIENTLLVHTSDINTINNTLNQLDTTYLKVNGSNAASPLYLNSVMLYNNSVSANSLSGAYVYTTHLSVADNADLEIRNARDKDIVLKTQNGGKVLYNYGSGYNEIATVNQIPTVNNSTITLTQGGVTKGTFTLNQSGDATINLDSGGVATDAERIVYNGNISGSFELTENNDGYLINKYTSDNTSISIAPIITYVAGSGLNRSTSYTHSGNFAVVANTLTVDTDVIVPRVTNYTPTGQSYTIDTTIDEGKVNIKDGFNNDEITIEANKVTFTSGGSSNILTTSSGDLTYQGNEIIDTNNLSNYLDGELKTINSESLVGTGDIKLLPDNTNTSNMIEAHKAYLADGDLLTDANGLAFVQAYSHSTFDLSKFTIVGSPTITSDGIASGFSSSNYIQYISADILSGKDWSILQKVYWDGSSNTNYLKIADNYSYLRIDASGACTGNFYNTGNQQIWIHTGTKRFNSAGWYYLGLKYEYSTGTFTTFGGNSLNNLSDFDTNVQGAGVELRNLSTGYITSINQENTGFIDLKHFSITVDGMEVFSGNKTGIDTYTIDGNTFTIPYTLSKTGSKIVQSVYRDRVADMYEQYGYAPYYTLSDTDFTLPMGEIYGMIGQRSLRDTYRNGIFYYDLYSDRTLEQGGSCTSGTAVTFLRPFVDTNYVLTVPYSAKTTAGFTPSQTGDWIAKGVSA